MPEKKLFDSLVTRCAKDVKNREWKTVIVCAQEILDEFPDRPHGLAWLAVANWHLGAHDKALLLADEAKERFPDSAWIWENRARLAGYASDWALASALWQECVERFPNAAGVYVEGSKALMRIGESQKAKKLLAAGLALFPNNWHLLVAEAEYFAVQSEWNKARNKWLGIYKKFPDNDFVRKKTIDVLHRVQDHVGAFNTIMEWIESGAETSANDYLLAVKAFIRVFDELDLKGEQTKDRFWLLINQPLDDNNPSNVAELVKSLQSLPLLDTLKYRNIVTYAQDLLSEHNKVLGSTARNFSLTIGVPNLALGDEEIFDLISKSDIDRFSRYFSGYLPHVENIGSLNSFLSKNADKAFLDRLSENGLNNLHLFAAANPDFDEKLQEAITKRLNLSGLGARMLAPAYNANKLRIAVCVSGQLRGYKAAFKTWDCLGLEEQDAHFFVHCWKDIGQKYPTPVNARRSFSGNFLSCFIEEAGLYGPAHIESEYPSLFGFYRTSSKATQKQISQLYSSESVVLEDDNEERFASFTNPMKMFYKIEKAWELAENSGKAFDLVIRVRPDKALSTRQKVDWDEIYQVCSKTPTIYTDGVFRINYDLNLITGDQFAVSTPDIMSHYSHIYANSLDKNGKIKDRKEYQHVHRKLAFTLYQNGIVGRKNPFIHPGFPLDPEKLKSTTILKLLMQDIDQRTPTQLDKTFVSALCLDF